MDTLKAVTNRAGEFGAKALGFANFLIASYLLFSVIAGNVYFVQMYRANQAGQVSFNPIEKAEAASRITPVLPKK